MTTLFFVDIPEPKTDYDNSKIVCDKIGSTMSLREYSYDEWNHTLYPADDEKTKRLCAASYLLTDEYKASHEEKIVPNDAGLHLVKISDRKVEIDRLLNEGHGKYHLDLVKKYYYEPSEYLKDWAIAFSVALLILFAIRQATIYILAGRS